MMFYYLLLDDQKEIDHKSGSRYDVCLWFLETLPFEHEAYGKHYDPQSLLQQPTIVGAHSRRYHPQDVSDTDFPLLGKAARQNQVAFHMKTGDVSINKDRPLNS
jgi:hypothetical protein